MLWGSVVKLCRDWVRGGETLSSCLMKLCMVCVCELVFAIITAHTLGAWRMRTFKLYLKPSQLILAHLQAVWL